jgi:hypothetical protein
VRYLVKAYPASAAGVCFTTACEGLQEARDVAVQVVHDRMEAFGEDREALTQYGFYRAEAEALDMPDEGGTIVLSDGWKIEVIRDDD